MGNYLTKGTTFADGGPCNAALLNAHVDDAILKATAISSQTLKDPAALSDEILINDGGSFKKETWQQVYELLIQSGTIIQTVSSEYTANTNLTTVIPFDDTIPQNTEGTEILSASITPRFSTSTILVRFQGFGAAATASVELIAALFRDSVVNAVAASSTFTETGIAVIRRHWGLEHVDSPSTTSAVTYKIRVGASTGTMRMNGSSASRAYGGVAKSTLVLQEIRA